MGKKILIIEDNMAFQKVLKVRLEAAGYMITTAKDGLEGLKFVREVMPDLIILDIMLPGMDGHKVCRLLKFNQKYQHIPIIIFTSRDLDEDAELAKQCGADAFVVKTTRIPIMLDVIEKLLEFGNVRAKEAVQ